MFISAHRHLCSSSHPHIYISHLHLSLFFTFSLKAGGSAAGAPRNATLCGDRACRGRESKSAFWPGPAQPSAEIVRAEGAKRRRECVLVRSGATLCGDHARREREMQARVRFVSARRNPLRRSCASRARNAGESAFGPGRGQPSAEIVRVEGAKCRRECVYVASRPSRLLGTSLGHHRSSDAIRGCHKKSHHDVSVRVLHLHDKRCSLGTHESLGMIVTSFALRSPCSWQLQCEMYVLQFYSNLFSVALAQLRLTLPLRCRCIDASPSTPPHLCTFTSSHAHIRRSTCTPPYIYTVYIAPAHPHCHSFTSTLSFSLSAFCISFQQCWTITCLALGPTVV